MDAEISSIIGLVKLKRLTFNEHKSFFNTHTLEIEQIFEMTKKSNYLKLPYILTITVNNLDYGENISDKLSRYIPTLKKSILNILLKL